MKKKNHQGRINIFHDYVRFSDSESKKIRTYNYGHVFNAVIEIDYSIEETRTPEHRDARDYWFEKAKTIKQLNIKK